MTAKSVLCQKVHFLWASVRVSRIADYIQTTWDMGSTISIQQTTNNWHKLCHWQHSNSTFSPPAVHVPSPSPHGCVAPHNVVYILSLYPLPYVSIIGRIDVVRCMIGPLSPLYLTTLSGPGYNWGSRSLPRSSMSTHHHNVLVTTIT